MKARYLCEVEDGRTFKTRQPYKKFVGNKVIKVTKVYFKGLFKKVIWEANNE